MVPTVEFPAVMPFTCQVTEVLLLLSTVAVNFCVLPAAKEAEGGEIVTLTGETVRVTLADADLVVSALEIAFTVITRSLETLAGATYSPEVEMVPLLEFPGCSVHLPGHGGIGGIQHRGGELLGAGGR